MKIFLGGFALLSNVPQRAGKRVKHVLCGVVFLALVEITNGELGESVVILKVAIQGQLAAKPGFFLVEPGSRPCCNIFDCCVHSTRLTAKG